MASHQQPQHDYQVPYDPLLEPPRSPRLPPEGAQAPYVPGQPYGSEFGAPHPGYYDPAAASTGGVRSSFAPSMSTYHDRASDYGSVAAFKLGSTASFSGAGGGRYQDDPYASHQHLPMSDLSPRRSRDLHEKNDLYAAPRTKTKRRVILWLTIVVALLVVIAAAAVPVYIFVIKPKLGNSSGTGSGNSTSSGNDSNNNNHQTTLITTGGDGSTVTKEDGSTFIYNNTFGGFWVYDPANPLNESARAQSYSPPLSEEWKWGEDRIFGVNLGGWLNLEPFISPALYEPFYPNAVDEWTLSELIQARDGNLNAIEDHYKTFITEEDFAMIAAAGLNWVRIPLPFWAIEVYPGEPFLPNVCWTYFLKAIEWSRKYGLRINLDFHAIPGSQNGWNHSGKIGQINFLNGVMGLANAQRALDYIRIIAEFISQPEYKNVVPFFGIMNEPFSSATSFPLTAIQSFYAEAYRIIRNAGGTGAGNGPVISIHEAFQGLAQWPGFLTGADRLALDSHPYLAFGTMSPDPIESFIPVPCTTWGQLFGDSMNSFGITAAGEWSHAINDCGLYLNAVGEGTRYEGTFETTNRIGSCDPWTDYQSWDQATKDALRQFSMSTMDALQDWFFWTWRIGESAATGKVETPFWSYKLALQEGWAVTDPRTAQGQCARIGVTGNTFTGPLQSWQVGGAGAGEVPDLDQYVWPPTSIGGYSGAASVSRLPQYTPTGALSTLPAATLTNSDAHSTTTVGNGWANSADQTPMAVPIEGCTYPDPWDALSAAIPACATPNAKLKREPVPGPTPTPAL